MVSSLAPKLRPPIPHEHGAWVVLYAPLLITAVVLPTAAIWQTASLVGLITAIFLARNCVSIVLRRKRGWENAAAWLGVFTALGLAAAWPLVAGPGGAALLMVGAIGATLFIVHNLLLLGPAPKRLDRTRQGQILAIAALCLNGPAQAAIATGRLPWIAWVIWLSCMVFFGSSVFYVKMLLDAAKYRDQIDLERCRLSRESNLYHGLMLVAAISLGAVVGGW